MSKTNLRLDRTTEVSTETVRRTSARERAITVLLSASSLALITAGLVTAFETETPDTQTNQLAPEPFEIETNDVTTHIFRPTELASVIFRADEQCTLVVPRANTP